MKYKKGVVNSFQISIFDFQATALAKYAPKSVELWIAFKLVSLTFKQQQFKRLYSSIIVVNSFQISIFDFQATATAQWVGVYTELWIAFKLVSLTFKQQLGFKIF